MGVQNVNPTLSVMWDSLTMEAWSSQTLGEEIITGQRTSHQGEASPVLGRHVIRTVVGPVSADVKEATEARRHCILLVS